MVEKIHAQKRGHTADVGVNTIGKHRVEQTFHLRGRFCFHIINNMAQIKKQNRSVVRKEVVSAGTLTDHFEIHFAIYEAPDINEGTVGFMRLMVAIHRAENLWIPKAPKNTKVDHRELHFFRRD